MFDGTSFHGVMQQLFFDCFLLYFRSTSLNEETDVFVCISLTLVGIQISWVGRRATARRASISPSRIVLAVVAASELVLIGRHGCASFSPEMASSSSSSDIDEPIACTLYRGRSGKIDSIDSNMAGRRQERATRTKMKPKPLCVGRPPPCRLTRSARSNGTRMPVPISLSWSPS